MRYTRVAREIADNIIAEKEAEEKRKEEAGKKAAEQNVTNAHKEAKADMKEREKLPPVDLNEPKASEISESVPDTGAVDKEPAQKR